MLHIINSILVFWFLFKLSSRIYPSLIASILFGIHPLHVESVAWISERKDLLSTYFFMLTIITYLYYINNKKRKFYYISLFIFILALMAKPSVFIIPFILLLCDYYLEKKFSMKTYIEKIPFCLIALLFIAITLISFNYETQETSRIKNILVASHGLIFYMSKTLFPVKLSAIYPPPVKGVLQVPAFLVSPFIVIILSVIIIFLTKYSKKIIIFGSLFFLISILPVISMSHNQNFIANDHYMYISSIGLFYMAGELFNWLYFIKFANYRKIRITLISTLIIIITILSFLTWERCKVWKDSMTLWNDVLKNYVSATAYNNRGLAYELNGEQDRAFDDFTKTLEIDKNYVEAYVNRGNIYLNKGDPDRAINEFNMALKIKPELVEAYSNRGIVYGLKGEYDRAIEDLTEAISINKNYISAYNNRGNVYYKKGEYTEAISDYNIVLNIVPDATVSTNRGLAYNAIGEYDKAIADYTEAIRLDPNYIKAYQQRGIIYGMKENYDKALEDFNKILTLKPDDKETLFNRAFNFFNMGKYDKAWQDINNMRRLNYEINPAFLEDLKAKSGKNN
jgi:tetratricopeptide (TPR) repeat protein